jgi:hypothetical protein
LQNPAAYRKQLPARLFFFFFENEEKNHCKAFKNEQKAYLGKASRGL